MRDFDYQAPTSLGEAVKLLADAQGRARPLAGGTDLIDQVRVGRLTPDVVVDLKKIPELRVLEIAASGVRIGAAVPCYQLYQTEALKRSYSALTDSAAIIGGIQIQSRASIGGNLCNSGPAADSTPSLIALGAQAVVAGPTGNREVVAEEFCTGPGKNVLQPGEVLVELKIPAAKPNSGSAYLRFIPRNEMDIAVVGVGVAVELDATHSKIVSARIALGAVGPKALFAQAASDLLAGQTISDELLQRAGAEARKIATPIDDMRGTIEFRLHVTGIMVERALKNAIARARGETVCGH